MKAQILRSLLQGLALFLLSTQLAQSAEITKLATQSGESDLILISGELTKGDDQKFKRLVFPIDKALVIFESAGGLVAPALEIGRAIRLKGFGTAVINAECASACALAWAAGQPRMMNRGSAIGFHAAYMEDDDGKKVPIAVGNALVGSYLRSLGLSDQFVAFATSAGPDEIRWLNKASADTLGLTVSFIDGKQRAIANFEKALKLYWSKPPQYSEAAQLYRLSADDGFAGAQNNLGDMYESGRGVPTNGKFAVYLYTRAAERGEPTAYLSLSTFLPRDTDDEAVLVEALKFAILAMKHLPEGRNMATAKSAVRTISARLPKEAIHHAIELASAWEPLYQEKKTMADTPRGR